MRLVISQKSFQTSPTLPFTCCLCCAHLPVQTTDRTGQSITAERHTWASHAENVRLNPSISLLEQSTWFPSSRFILLVCLTVWLPPFYSLTTSLRSPGVLCAILCDTGVGKKKLRLTSIELNQPRALACVWICFTRTVKLMIWQLLCSFLLSLHTGEDIHRLGAGGMWSCAVMVGPPVGGKAAQAEAAQLATATLPIFRPVNKLWEQMDLWAEMHSAPLERLKLSLADLF